jgi:polar amino acid transport system permease protein
VMCFGLSRFAYWLERRTGRRTTVREAPKAPA